MVFINIVLTILFFLLPVMFVIGLIKPDISLWYLKKKTRGLSSLIYGISWVVVFILIANTIDHVPEEYATNDQPTITEEAPATNPPSKDTVIATTQTEPETKTDEKQKSKDLPFDKPSKFENNSAQKTLSEYVSAWKNKNWNKMASLTQLSWRNGTDDPEQMLSGAYDFMTIKGFEIQNVTTKGSAMKEISYSLAYGIFDGEVKTENYKANVIFEQGSWGVNPISVRKK